MTMKLRPAKEVREEQLKNSQNRREQEKATVFQWAEDVLAPLIEKQIVENSKQSVTLPDPNIPKFWEYIAVILEERGYQYIKGHDGAGTKSKIVVSWSNSTIRQNNY
jgi:hypothetical protein